MLVSCICLAIIILDQVTKYLVRTNIELHGHIQIVNGFFSITHIHNKGAAWGILDGYGVVLIALSIVMVFILIKYRSYFMSDTLFHKLILALMLGGIIGNLIDRVFLGYVVDFLNFYWKVQSRAFPSFNVADSCICVGVALYMVAQFFHIDGRKSPVQMIGPNDLGGKA